MDIVENFEETAHFNASRPARGDSILGSFADNIYLTERFDVVDIRRKFDEDLNQHSVDTWRVDAVTELFMPLDFRYFQVAPFIPTS